MLNVVLVEPEIPSNAGNVGRTCALTGARLHLVGPLGFSLSDHALRRAGLAFWKSLDVRTYASWEDFLSRNPQVAAEIESPSAEPRVHLLTKAGGRVYADTRYHDGDWLVFGRESTGLPAELLRQAPWLCERIPMRPEESLADVEVWHASHERLHPDVCGNQVDPRGATAASLNLSNAVAIVTYEALRQTEWPEG